MPFIRIVEALTRVIAETALAAAGPTCPIPGFPCPTTLISMEFFDAYVGRIAGTIAGSAFGIIAGMLIFYSLKLATSGQDESHASEVRNAYLHVIFGAVLIAGASFIAAVFQPPSATTAVSNIVQPASLLASVLVPMRNFFFTMVAAALTINIAYHGAKLIVVQEEGSAGAARKGIIQGTIGLAAVFLAGIAVNTFGFDAFTGATSPLTNLPISAELAGIGRFLMMILGGLTVICVVMAGFFLVISADEQLKDRSKKIVIGVAVTFIVVSSTYVILSVFF